MNSNALSTTDRFEIFEQLHRHQACIDGDARLESALKYVDLYWPEATFTVHDLREMDFVGPGGLKQLYDYAHSVFPLHKWRHALGTFVIEGTGHRATAHWRWTVSWQADREGIVSTGSYTDVFEKRGGIWKCLKRTSDIDSNWPAALFQPFVDAAETTFKAS